MIDPTALRDRIAAALYDHSHPGWAISFPDLDQDQRDTYLSRADAVLAVLPATADRRAVLREAADEIAGIDFHPNARARSLDIAAGLARRLRRMADETAATEAEPRTTVTIEMLAGVLAAHVDLLTAALGNDAASVAAVPTEIAGMRRAIDLLKLHKARLLNLQQHADLIRTLGPFLAAFADESAAGARQDGADRG